MKPTQAALQAILALLLAPYLQSAPCPMAGTQLSPPMDATHISLQKPSGLRHRRIASLSQEKLHSIISNGRQRTLQECLTSSTYDAIDADVAAIASTFLDDESRSHFLGGIVRLAAHDFLDYNMHDSTYGPDGCIDFSHESNAGLEEIWCADCELTRVYESNYLHVSKADFWVAAAAAVIRQTSSGGLDLRDSFVWGRVDNESCPESAARLPAATGCSEVEDVFLNRLGLSYVDAVALVGAHTLGRGDANFSGHHGIWVDTVGDSLVFDKRFYEEIIRRAWIPRNEGAENEDWTWGGRNGNSPRFMLHTDMCLMFDIEHTFPCCSRLDRFNNAGVNQCRDLNETQCSSYADTSPRKEAADAVNLFATGGGNNIGNANNEPWYQAFQEAWNKATTNGWDALQPLAEGCTVSPTVSPRQSPSVTPTSTSPTATCHDEPSFHDNKGRERECSWVIDADRNRCKKFAHFCPVTCSECDCLLFKRVCSADTDCCSGDCVDGQCACLQRDSPCSSNEVCCSGVCQDNGTCAGGTGSGGSLFQ